MLSFKFKKNLLITLIALATILLAANIFLHRYSSDIRNNDVIFKEKNLNEKFRNILSEFGIDDKDSAVCAEQAIYIGGVHAHDAVQGDGGGTWLIKTHRLGLGDAEALPVDDGIAGALIDVQVVGVRLRYGRLSVYHLPPLREGEDLYGKGQGVDHVDQEKRSAFLTE